MSIVFPTGLASKEISESVHLLGQIRKTSLVLYGIFVELTRQFFSDEANLLSSMSTVWSPDEAKTTIFIDTEFKEDEKTVGARPAVFVKLGDIVYNNTKGDSSRSSSPIGMDLEEGEYIYSRYGETTITLDCVGRTKGEVAIIASAVHDFFDAFSDIIRKDFCFELFAVTKLSKIELSKEFRDRYHSGIECYVKFQDTWTLKLESPKVKQIIIHASERAADALSL